MYLFSAGSAKAVETGKNTLVYASIGLIIIFGSYLPRPFRRNINAPDSESPINEKRKTKGAGA